MTRKLATARSVVTHCLVALMVGLALGVVFLVDTSLNANRSDTLGDASGILVRGERHTVSVHGKGPSREVCWWSATTLVQCRPLGKGGQIGYRSSHLYLVHDGGTALSLVPVETDLPDGAVLFPPSAALEHSVPRSPRFPMARGIYWSDLGGRLEPYRIHRPQHGVELIEHPSGAWIQLVRCCGLPAFHTQVLWWEDGRMVGDVLLSNVSLGRFGGAWPTARGVRLFAWREVGVLGEDTGFVDLAARTLERLEPPNRLISNLRRRAVRAALWGGLVMLILLRLWPRRLWRFPVEGAVAVTCVYVSVPLVGLLSGLPMFW